ncbi:hypothetical protein MN116_000345, partial [Schistosoma mekongi]
NCLDKQTIHRVKRTTMNLISVILLSVTLFEHLLAQPMEHIIPGDQGNHIDVGNNDNHDGDDDMDDMDDADDVDDSHSSPSQLLQGSYRQNKHYGGGNYHSGYYRPNKHYGNAYGGRYSKGYRSGYRH